VVWLSTAGFVYTGSNITRTIREKYLAAILSQNIAFFETLGAGEITTSITHNTDLIQIGISENVGLILMALSTVITAISIAFSRYWKLSLILLSTIVALLVVSGTAGRRSAVFKNLNLEVERKSSALAEEVFSSIQNVFAFNAQNEIARKYQTMLRQSEKYSFRDHAIFSTMLAAIVGILFWNYVSITTVGSSETGC
jgi:ATP-binding cassette subfamily B (MDR/TAP) protein 1